MPESGWKVINLAKMWEKGVINFGRKKSNKKFEGRQRVDMFPNNITPNSTYLLNYGLC